ncbi:MAG TPA: hypothetical protein VE568_06715 [Rubrobacter sp.]|nr:hypothetical protein [Rubrobacter sp.]
MSAGNGAAGHEWPTSTRLFLAVAASAVFVTVLTPTMINVLVPLGNYLLDAGCVTASVIYPPFGG